MGDKVMSPPKGPSRPAAMTRQTKNSVIEGATATADNMTSFNRKGKKGK